MLINVLFFLIAGGTLTLLLWTGLELFRTQEDPLADRLEELQSQSLAVSTRAARRKGGTGLDRFLYVVSLFPGGEDWIRGSERLLHRAGVRRSYATPLYIASALLFVL